MNKKVLITVGLGFLMLAGQAGREFPEPKAAEQVVLNGVIGKDWSPRGRQPVTRHGYGVQPTGEFPVMCFDPLLTNTVILDIDGCGYGAEPIEQVEPVIAHPTPVVVVTPQAPQPVEQADSPVIGNPGNDKPVGHAGEKCDKGMCEQGTQGNKGKSNK